MTILVLLGAIQGVLLVSFLFFKKSNQKANRAAALSTLFTAIVALLIFFSGELTQSDFQLNLKFSAWFLSFPIPVFLFFYVKFVTSEFPKVFKLDWLHAVPTLIAMVYVSQFFMMDYESKLAYLDVQNVQYVQTYKVFELLQGVGVIVYSLWSIKLLWEFGKKIRNEFSNLHRKQLNWLWGLLSFSSLIGLAGVVGASIGLADTVEGENKAPLDETSTYITYAIVAVAFYWIGYKAMTQPRIFDYKYSGAESDIKSSSLEIGLKEKYEHSYLTEDDENQLAKLVLTYLEDSKPYLDQNLSLTGLAGQLGLSKHVLSQLINQHFKKNFFDFINGYRIEDAKQKLVNEDFAYLTIEGIAGEAGFRSKSTFYKIFKELVGMSPSSYQKEYN